MSNIILKKLVKTYDNKKNIIDDINLEIRDNEFLVLIGSSGCGKSTLLRLISGLENITSGEILIDGKIMNDVLPKDRDVAFVFQNYALYPHLTVRENISFGLKMRRFSKKIIDEKVIEVSKALELEQLLDRKPKQLSGGQRQRVALGRAIVRNPKIFLMDEPLSNLDANLRIQMRSEIKKLHKKLGTTFIYVTHDQTEALTMADRIVVLDKGKIQQIDTPEDIYNKPKNMFVAGFIGQMNFIKVTIRDGDFLINNTLFHKENLSDGEYYVGIRSENMMSGSSIINVNCDFFEMTGSDYNCYFKLNNSECIAKIQNKLQLNENNLTIRLSVQNMLFYNSTSRELV